MYSEFEELVLDAIKKEFGSIREEMDEKTVMEKVKASRNLYEYAVEEYRVNQSAKNYNLLITGMVSLQYWNQKKVRLFSITEEF